VEEASSLDKGKEWISDESTKREFCEDGDLIVIVMIEPCFMFNLLFLTMMVELETTCRIMSIGTRPLAQTPSRRLSISEKASFPHPIISKVS
jgi:hypothetical protein